MLPATMAFWLDLFTRQTWEEFLSAGGRVSGFRERQASFVKQERLGVSGHALASDLAASDSPR
jgi:hypothetical protein